MAQKVSDFGWRFENLCEYRAQSELQPANCRLQFECASERVFARMAMATASENHGEQVAKREEQAERTKAASSKATQNDDRAKRSARALAARSSV